MLSKARAAGIWADWEVISPEQVHVFEKALDKGEHELSELLQDILIPLELEPAPTHLEMDMSWEPLHRCLTNDHSANLDWRAGTPPLSLCVLGGKQLLEGGYSASRKLRSVSVLKPDEVVSVADEVENISKEWLRERFFQLPDTLFYDIDDSAFEWTWESFELLKEFFKNAANENSGVIHVIAQS